MIEQQFEELAKRWPALFQKSGDFELSVGQGWYGIIDTLCRFISHKVETLQIRLKYAMENPGSTPDESIKEIEARLEQAIADLPTIVQVKEKFGTLRFYVYGGTPEMNNYIEFAEGMSRITCEVCGNPGKSRNTGWVMVLCDLHHRENEAGQILDMKSISSVFDYDHDYD
jgi:hypothetical protein